MTSNEPVDVDLPGLTRRLNDIERRRQLQPTDQEIKDVVRQAMAVGMNRTELANKLGFSRAWLYQKFVREISAEAGQ